MENTQSLKTVKELLKESWTITKQKAKTLYAINAVIYLALLLLFGFVTLSATGSTENLKNIDLSAVGVTSILIAIPVFIFIVIWVQVALLKAIIHSYGFKESFRISMSFVWPYFITSLIAALIVFGGFILLIVPGIIFAVWYYFAPLITVAEGKKGMEALRKSKSYVKGRWGAIAWRLGAPVLLLIIIQIMIGLPFDEDISGLIDAVFSFIVAPFLIVYDYLLYKNAKETSDTAEALQQIPSV